MLNLNSVMIGTMQPKVLATFYEKIFDKKPDMVDGEWYGWQVGAGFLTIGHHSKMEGKTKDAGRMMFNLETEDVQGTFARMETIDDIEIVKKPYEMGGMWIATLADPDGNFFQLMSPWKES